MSIKVIDPSPELKKIAIGYLLRGQFGRSVTNPEVIFYATGGNVLMFTDKTITKVDFDKITTYCYPMPIGTQVIITSEN